MSITKRQRILKVWNTDSNKVVHKMMGIAVGMEIWFC